jgi:hypothetical protein
MAADETAGSQRSRAHFGSTFDALMRRGFIRLGARSGCKMQFSGYHHDLDVDCEARVGDPSNSC